MPPDHRLHLPPIGLIDDEAVAAAVERWQAAVGEHRQARQNRVECEQAELPAAVEADKAADVAALEAGAARWPPGRESRPATASECLT
jgi:hypothetical protein